MVTEVSQAGAARVSCAIAWRREEEIRGDERRGEEHKKSGCTASRSMMSSFLLLSNSWSDRERRKLYLHSSLHWSHRAVLNWFGLQSFGTKQQRIREH